MTIHIDVARALELLREVVAEKGADYVYEYPVPHRQHCVYQSRGNCSCLVGHVLHRAGLPVEELERMDAQLNAVIDEVEVRGVELTQGARQVLRAAQEAQDDGVAWGMALEAAEAVAAQLTKAGGA